MYSREVVVDVRIFLWSLFIIFFCLFILALLYWFSARRKRKELIERSKREFPDLPDKLLTSCNRSVLFSSAEALYKHMLERIQQAEHHIHMVYYIWNDDVIGRTFQRALIAKANKGVTVRIIYDGFGAHATGEFFWEELRQAGVQVHCFSPMLVAFLDRRLNDRNHRKLTIVDGQFGYIGGINIGDEYLGKDERFGYWRDSAVGLEGDAVNPLQWCFFKDWYYVSGHRVGYNEDGWIPPHGVTQNEQVQIIASGPDHEQETLVDIYSSVFSKAKERIYIGTPYLVPDRKLLETLRTAAKAGVDVRIIIPGVADSKLALWASLSFVEPLLTSGVRVYRYAKGFMHAKTIVVDRTFAFIGSANFDLRSFHSNYELNAAFYSGPMMDRIEADLICDLGDSREVMLEEFMERSARERMKEQVGRIMSPLL